MTRRTPEQRIASKRARAAAIELERDERERRFASERAAWFARLGARDLPEVRS